ncbi:hypothetical protein ABPG74_007669 [Tetrahymena malaccensis]
MDNDLEGQKKQAIIITDPLPEKTKFPSAGLLNGRVRFNIIMNLGICAFIVVPFFVPVIYSIGIQCYFSLQWLVFFIFYFINTIRIMKVNKSNVKKKCNNKEVVKLDKIDSTQNNTGSQQDTITTLKDSVQQKYKYKFIMMTFIYKEPLELLMNTLENLKEMHGSNQMIVAVGFEERTPDKDDKINQLKLKYEQVFEELIITIHPFGIEGEIPGKCSNCNYVQRQLVFHLQKTRINFDINEYMLTNFDTDTRFQKNYLQILEHQVKETCKNPEDIHNIVWQPILYYNWDLQNRTFFVRITSLLRNMLMMGALIPFQINVMSIFTFSLKLCVEGGYTHPAYQMEDIICFIRWFIKKQKQIQIKAVYSPTLSGPTSGNSFLEELYEWATQLKRWTIGSAEVFHYFIVHSNKIQPNTQFTLWGWSYFNYYVLFMIAQSFFSISCALSFSLLKQQDIQLYEFYITIGTLCFQYLIYTLMFIVNGLSQYLLDPIREKEKINLLLTLVHIIISPLTLLVYSIIAFYGLFEAIYKGKKACNHIASKKEELK